MPGSSLFICRGKKGPLQSRGKSVLEALQDHNTSQEAPVHQAYSRQASRSCQTQSKQVLEALQTERQKLTGCRLGQWMTHFVEILNVPLRVDSDDTHLFDVNLPHVPSAAPLNSPISPDELSAAITALNHNKASDLYGMRSELIIDAAALLITPISTVFNKIFNTSFPSTHSIGRLALFSSREMSMI